MRPRGPQRCGECTGGLTRGEEGGTELDGEAQRLGEAAIVAGLLGSTRSSPDRAGAITRSTGGRRRKKLGTGGSGGKESQRWPRRQQWRRGEGDWRIYRRRATAQRLSGWRGLPATERRRSEGVRVSAAVSGKRRGSAGGREREPDRGRRKNWPKGPTSQRQRADAGEGDSADRRDPHVSERRREEEAERRRRQVGSGRQREGEEGEARAGRARGNGPKARLSAREEIKCFFFYLNQINSNKSK